jgi:hypothetical protein
VIGKEGSSAGFQYKTWWEQVIAAHLAGACFNSHCVGIFEQHSGCYSCF